jgi:purine-binding chemotaxis protein CheW
MKNADLFFSFAVEGHRYALPLASVDKIIHTVEITPLPKAPKIILGIINFRGRIIPVVNLRKRFGLPERDIELSDQLIIAETPKRPVALLAVQANGVVKIDKCDVVKAEKILPGAEFFEGVVKLTDGLLLIHDLATFLSLDEEKSLSAALRKGKEKQ